MTVSSREQKPLPARAQIRDIAGCLPDFALTNDMLGREFPEWNLALAARQVGVTSRRVAAADETALDMASRACESLLDRQPGLREKLDTIIFCTQSADYVMPPNSCLLHGRLGLGEDVATWDINHACSGYIYSLGMAHSLIQAGMAQNLLVVTADTYTKYINPRDRSARMLFGDGAAATWVAASESRATKNSGNAATDDVAGVCDVMFGTAGMLHDKFIVPAGGCRLPRSMETGIEQQDKSGNFRSQENIHMAGQDILNFVTSKIPDHIRSVLARNELALEDIDLFVFHQASALVLDMLERLLRLPAGKSFRHLEEIGNTVSSSIPLALRVALDSGRAKPGDTVLLCGFGVGLSWGSVVLKL